MLCAATESRSGTAKPTFRERSSGMTRSVRRSGVATGSSFVLSPHAVESKWVKRELLYSLQQDRFDGRIVPLLYRCCSHDDLSWTLSQMQMVEFTSSFDDGCRDLLRIWGVGYARAPRSR